MDVRQAIERIDRYTAGLDAESFKADDMRIDSVLFNLMTIGEAVKNLPDDVRDDNPDVRWRDMARFRDRVVHHYFGIDADIIWEIVEEHLPVLRQHIEGLLKDIEDSEHGEEQ